MSTTLSRSAQSDEYRAIWSGKGRQLPKRGQFHAHHPRNSREKGVAVKIGFVAKYSDFVSIASSCEAGKLWDASQRKLDSLFRNEVIDKNCDSYSYDVGRDSIGYCHHWGTTLTHQDVGILRAPPVFPFISHANRLAATGEIDAALDLIYDQVDALLLKSEFGEIDSLLSQLNPEEISVDIMLGLLTSTLPPTTKLRNRRAFFLSVEREIKAREEWEPGILVGLGY